MSLLTDSIQAPAFDENFREVAVLVQLTFPGERKDLSELILLAKSARLNPEKVIVGERKKPEAKYFVGSGKVEEIFMAVTCVGASVVLFDHPLSPAQARNLERAFNCKVIDRSELILDIFASRARTFEGKLQVELAQLQHLSTRLVRGWTHLERQKGGIGLRGPGETQLESDRRLVRDRIKVIKNRLEKVSKQRFQNRRARERTKFPTVALVGYTNAGKSSLFNLLTKASVVTEDRLFSTLDPTLRNVVIPHFGPIILADTVGFIQDLPHDLINAFSATLEEVKEADLLLHLVDASDEDRFLKIEQVKLVIEELGADKIPVVIVYNKIDLVAHAVPHCHLASNDEGGPRVWLSVANNQGFDLLGEALNVALSDQIIHCCVELGPLEAKIRASFYNAGGIVAEKITDKGGWKVEVRLSRSLYLQIMGSVGIVS
jgi:GTP-binding protein HflX